MAGSVVKDAGEIWNRLFDHRPYLAGEIKHFVHEFEEKRQDREIARLFTVLERVTEIRDTQLDRIKQGSNDHLPGLSANLEVALNMCNRMIESEKHHLSNNSTLESKRALRQAEWESFIGDMALRNSEVDKAFKEREAQLGEFYQDLENKLHLSN